MTYIKFNFNNGDVVGFNGDKVTIVTDNCGFHVYGDFSSYNFNSYIEIINKEHIYILADNIEQFYLYNDN